MSPPPSSSVAGKRQRSPSSSHTDQDTPVSTVLETVEESQNLAKRNRNGKWLLNKQIYCASINKFLSYLVHSFADLKETDPKKIESRYKQISFGKNTIGYDNYLAAVPV